MEIYELNKEAFTKKYGAIALIEDEEVIVEAARKEGVSTIKVIKNGQSYYLHSRYTPVLEAEKNAEKIYSSGKLHILIGNGLGYLAQTLLSHFSKKDYLLIIEPSKAIFNKCLATNNIRELITSNQVSIFLGEVNEQLDMIFNALVNVGYFNRFTVYISNNYERAFKNQVEKITKKIKDVALIHKVNINTSVLYSEKWHENYLKNIPSAINSVPINAFRNKFVLPVIIVAAGPSLLDEIEYLRELRNRAIIIAAGSAITTLAKYEIKPHFIVSIDGAEANYKHFQNINYSDVPLFYSPMLHNKIVAEYQGPKVVFQVGEGSFFNWYNDLLGFNTSSVLAGPSVANTTLDVVKQITSGPICLIGQDLGYTDGYSHAIGNRNREKIDVNNTKIYQIIESNDGKQLYTDYSYLSMKKWFEDYLKSKEITNVYNATKKGAKIAGTTIIDFQDFIVNYCQEEKDIEQEIYDIIQKNNSKEWINSHKDYFKNKIRENLNTLYKLIEYSSEAREISQDMIEVINKRKNKNINQLLNKLDKIDKKIKRINEKDTLLYFIIQPALINIDYWDLNEIYESEFEEYEDIARKNYYLYDKLYTMSKKIKEYLNNLEVYDETAIK